MSNVYDIASQLLFSCLCSKVTNVKCLWYCFTTLFSCLCSKVTNVKCQKSRVCWTTLFSCPSCPCFKLLETSMIFLDIPAGEGKNITFHFTSILIAAAHCNVSPPKNVIIRQRLIKNVDWESCSLLPTVRVLALRSTTRSTAAHQHR